MDDTLYNNEERINRYLQGEMTPDEETLFEADLQKDNNLKHQAESIARLVKEMEVVGNERDKELVNNIKASSEKKATPARWISIAASFAIIFTFGYYIYDYTATTSLGREYASTFPTNTIIRGEDDEEVVKTLTALFNNVANGEDLDNTIKQLEELWTLSQSDTYNSYTTYEPYIGWNLAIAYLRNNDKKEAKVVLAELQTMYPVGTVTGDKTFILLKEL